MTGKNGAIAGPIEPASETTPTFTIFSVRGLSFESNTKISKNYYSSCMDRKLFSQDRR